MNDREKSDPGIVAVKPANKPGQPGAEPVEPRPGTKGNANRQSTLRTQGRARVTQALGRVRQAAKRGKTERFTALLHHIDVDMLRAAFLALKRKAAAGADGVTWEDYEVGVELRLANLHDRVHGGTTARNRPAGRTYRRRTDASGCWRSRRSRTRSSRAQPPWC